MAEQLPVDPFEIQSQQIDDLVEFADCASILQDAINALAPGAAREALKHDATVRLNEIGNTLLGEKKVICRGDFFVAGLDRYGHVVGHRLLEKDQLVAETGGVRIYEDPNTEQGSKEIVGYSLIMARAAYYNWLDDTKITYRAFAPVQTTTLEFLESETNNLTAELSQELIGDDTAEELEVTLANSELVDFPSLAGTIECAVDAEVPDELMDVYMLHLDNVSGLKGQTLTMMSPIIAIRESPDLMSFEYPKNPFVGEVLGFCMDSEIVLSNGTLQNFIGNKASLYVAVATAQHESGVVLVPARYIDAYEML